jgi:predicted Fe-Mo cluster-binding NifX family protein
MKQYLFILLLFFVSCFDNQNNQNKPIVTGFEKYNRLDYEAMQLKSSDINSIEIYENNFYEETKKEILSKDTIELIIYNMIRYKNEVAQNRAIKLYYTVNIKTIDDRVFQYQFWVCNTGAVYFNIHTQFDCMAEPEKRNDFFMAFFYGIYKKRI